LSGFLLLPQFANTGQILLKLFDGIVVHFMLFQEAIEIVARWYAQELAELVARQAVFAVSFEGEGLQCSAGGVLTGRRKGSGQVVGNLQSDLHGFDLLLS
jgi:hypothetical protein